MYSLKKKVSFSPRPLKVTAIGQVLIILRFLESLEIIIAIFCRTQIPDQFLPLDFLEKKSNRPSIFFYINSLKSSFTCLFFVVQSLFTLKISNISQKTMFFEDLLHFSLTLNLNFTRLYKLEMNCTHFFAFHAINYIIYII